MADNAITAAPARLTPEGEPQPPENLATYVREGVKRQDPEMLRKLADWALDLALWRERDLELEVVVGEDERLVDVDEDESAGTIVTKMVPCGKETCTTCPHGPYQYRVERDGDSVTWEYIGKV